MKEIAIQKYREQQLHLLDYIAKEITQPKTESGLSSSAQHIYLYKN